MSILIDRKIAELRRAYHCPHGMAVRLFHRESAGYRCIRRLGPMRVHWKPGYGWLLYNQPIGIDTLAHIQKQKEMHLAG